MKQGWLKFSWKQFGADVRAMREARGYSLRECASKLNLDTSQLLRLERGRATGTQYFIYLCEWMGKNPVAYAIEHPMKESLPASGAPAKRRNRN
jgi:transcriptional regulator with XRE-family HTH domain